MNISSVHFSLHVKHGTSWVTLIDGCISLGKLTRIKISPLTSCLRIKESYLTYNISVNTDIWLFRIKKTGYNLIIIYTVFSSLNVYLISKESNWYLFLYQIIIDKLDADMFQNSLILILFAECVITFLDFLNWTRFFMHKKPV